MQNKTTSESPLEIIDKLYKDINKGDWLDKAAQTYVLHGVALVKQTLEKEGFKYEVYNPYINTDQLSFL